MKTVVTLAIPTCDLLTSNQARVHWATRARRVKNIRASAQAAARMVSKPWFEGMPCSAPVTAEVEVTWPDRRRRDAHNLQPTIKAAIDGIVDAGLLADDSDQHIKALTITATEKRLKTVGVACYLRIIFTPVEAS